MLLYNKLGMVMLYNKSPIMWKSKMQKTTALSTAEAEYYSASAAGCEVAGQGRSRSEPTSTTIMSAHLPGAPGARSE